MKRYVFQLAALAGVCIAAGGATGYWYANTQAVTQRDEIAKDAAPAGSQALYWYDPMAPAQHFDKPGKSPFMDMPLIAKYADETTSDKGVRIDAGMVQNLAIRLTTVVKSQIDNRVSVVANVVLNDRDVAIVQARSNGFVQHSYPLAVGDVVKVGSPLVDLLMPDWAGAQGEYLAMRSTGDRTLTNAAKQRLLLLGMPPSLIRQVEQSGKPQPVFTLTAPITGVIQSLDVRQGMAVSGGNTLVTLNGISSVWLDVAVPEAQGSQAVLGQPVQIIFPAYPGKTFTGNVSTILPVADAASRTLKVRVELANPQQQFRPGMFAQVSLRNSSAPDYLTVPSEAVIHTGLRDVVIVSDGNHHFAPVDVTLGPDAAGKTAIIYGLTQGQQVVASGQFLIDSEASLQGLLGRMGSAENKGSQP